MAHAVCIETSADPTNSFDPFPFVAIRRLLTRVLQSACHQPSDKQSALNPECHGSGRNRFDRQVQSRVVLRLCRTSVCRC
jgi:hypothetical protein